MTQQVRRERSGRKSTDGRHHAEAVLALDAIKRELRIPLQDHEHDELVLAERDAAVSFVSAFLRAPLVDIQETRRPSRPDDAGGRRSCCGHRPVRW